MERVGWGGGETALLQIVSVFVAFLNEQVRRRRFRVPPQLVLLSCQAQLLAERRGCFGLSLW